MCGIIGYAGTKDVVPLLLEGLKKLEYRGYDSSGIGVVSSENGKIFLCKTDGKIKNLSGLLQSRPLPKSFLGISHTRWATHGAPNRSNAHPHSDCTGKILVVHNGIIENYEGLKGSLQKKGHRFSSDTDTEVIAHLVEEYDRGDLAAAVQKAIQKLKGAFALGVISAGNPDYFVAARIGSPLVLGVGKDGNFMASDVPAILEHTNKIIYLKDEQMAVVRKDRVQLYRFNGQRLRHKIDRVHFKVDAAGKQGFSHFMLKEIHEQPAVLKHLFNRYVKKGSVRLEGLTLTDQQLRGIEKIVVVACGTAYHAGLVGKYMFEALTGLPVMVDVSSEFRYRGPILDKKTLVLAVSQSGETADTLAAVKEAGTRGARIVSVCNVLGSSLTRESDAVVYTHAGPEIGVASTKAYTAQLSVFFLLAVKWGLARGTISRKLAGRLLKDFKKIPDLQTQILRNKSAIAKIARKNSHFGCFLYLGRNINYPTALEGALKLKEISYIPAEGYAAGEMKHGPIALIDEYRAVVCLAPESATYEKMISNIQEIRSRKGKIIAVATEGDTAIKKYAPHVIYVPKIHALLTPLLTVLPLQLIAYYIAVKRGCDVDQPRNLAKSVTVE